MNPYIIGYIVIGLATAVSCEGMYASKTGKKSDFVSITASAIAGATWPFLFLMRFVRKLID